MGAYVNPPTGTKEDWLALNARELTRAEAELHTDFENDLLVVLVQNAAFSAAGVAFSPGEKDVFLNTCNREKRYFQAPKSLLLLASNLVDYL